MLWHTSNWIRWSLFSWNKNQLVAPLVVCARERVFWKVIQKVQVFWKVVGFQKTHKFQEYFITLSSHSVQVKAVPYLHYLCFVLPPSHPSLCKPSHASKFPLCPRWLLPTFSRALILQRVIKENYFYILGYRIGTSEMYFTEDFQAWLAKEQKGLFSLLYTSISFRSASVTTLLCIAASGHFLATVSYV